jgi:hypothetical protein
MGSFLPSKKLLVFFIVPLLIGLVVFIIIQFQNNDISYQRLPNSDNSSQNLAHQVSEYDKDNDGLKDWEEILWKTDPNNPDTDGDGTGDNEEIILKRDPTVAGPNDSLKTTELAKKMTDENITRTDVFTREFFTEYLSLKNKNVLNPENQNEFIDSYIKDNLTRSQIKEYTVNDFYIIQNDVFSDKQTYYNSIQKEIDKLFLITENELFTISKIVEVNNPEDIEKLKFAVSVYKEMVNDLISLSVPESVLNIHLNMVNNLNKLAENINLMKDINTDPISGLEGLQNYSPSEEALAVSFSKLRDYFERHNIN